MRLVLGVLAAGAAGALWLADSTDRQAAPGPAGVAAETATATPTAEPVIAPRRVLATAGMEKMAVVSPRTLRATAAPITSLDVGEGVLSPDGRRVALAPHPPGGDHVRILDIARNRLSGAIGLGDGGGAASRLTWVDSRRLAVFSSSADSAALVEIDAVAGTLLSRRPLEGEPMATARSSLGAVALLAPFGRVGQAKLIAGDRTVPLPGIRAGAVRDGKAVQHVRPGLAVDPATDRAYVVDAELDRIAVVDLRDGRAKLWLPLGPVARAGKYVDGRTREAAWLGDGKLAVSGSHDLPDGRIEPYGLRLVDVTTREQTMLAPNQDILAAGGGRAIAWQLEGLGIAVYGPDGRSRRLLRGVQVTHARVLGDYAYASTFTRKGRTGPTVVVDLRSGKVAARVKRRLKIARASQTGPAREPVLGIDYRRGPQGRLSAYDPVTLKPQGPSVKVPGYFWGWDRSPDGKAIAIGASNRGRIIIAGTSPLRARRLIAVGTRSAFRTVRWATPDRLIGLIGDGDPTAMEIDPATGAVVARHRLSGHVVAESPTATGIAFLTGPAKRSGQARLIVLEPEKPPRSIALPDVEVNVFGRPDQRPDDPPQMIPGLAVQDGAAYVAPVSGAQRIVRVDLASGTVTSHGLTAAAAKGGALRMRFLTPVGDGRLLLATHAFRHNGREDEQSVKLLDTAAWRARTLTTRSAGAGASAHGIAIPLFEPRRLLIHDPAGRRVATLRPRFGLSATHVHGRYVYVRNGARKGRNHRTHVVDLTNGRIVHTLPFSRLPQLLTRP
jgi:DNA-binding beta-propeller fold protein YncE